MLVNDGHYMYYTVISTENGVVDKVVGAFQVKNNKIVYTSGLVKDMLPIGPITPNVQFALQRMNGSYHHIKKINFG